MKTDLRNSDKRELIRWVQNEEKHYRSMINAFAYHLSFVMFFDSHVDIHFYCTPDQIIELKEYYDNEYKEYLLTPDTY